MAALADGKSVLRRLLVSDDTVAMTAGLRALGARIESLDDRRGERTSGGRWRPGDLTRPLGTTLRFLALWRSSRVDRVLDAMSRCAVARSSSWSMSCAHAGAEVVTDHAGRRLHLRHAWRRRAARRCRRELTVRHGAAPRRPYGDDTRVEVGVSTMLAMSAQVDAWSLGRDVVEEAPGASGEAGRRTRREESVEHEQARRPSLRPRAATGARSPSRTPSRPPSRRSLRQLLAAWEPGSRGPVDRIERPGDLTGVAVDLEPCRTSFRRSRSGRTGSRGTMIAAWRSPRHRERSDPSRRDGAAPFRARGGDARRLIVPGCSIARRPRRHYRTTASPWRSPHRAPSRVEISDRLVAKTTRVLR